MHSCFRHEMVMELRFVPGRCLQLLSPDFQSSYCIISLQMQPLSPKYTTRCSYIYTQVCLWMKTWIYDDICATCKEVYTHQVHVHVHFGLACIRGGDACDFVLVFAQLRYIRVLLHLLFHIHKHTNNAYIHAQIRILTCDGVISQDLQKRVENNANDADVHRCQMMKCFLTLFIPDRDTTWH